MSYVEKGGDAQYLRPLNEYFKFTPLAQIDQAAIDKAAKVLYPGCANSTLNRQVYTPVSAVKMDGARAGLCDWVPIERPKQPKPRVRSLQPDEAERLIEAAADHLRPILEFMFGTGARVSEALYLDWAQVDLNRAHVSFLETKNGNARGMPLHPRVSPP